MLSPIFLQDVKAVLQSYPNGRELVETITQKKRADKEEMKVIKLALVSHLVDNYTKK